MTNVTQFTPRTPKQQMMAGLLSMTDDECADLMHALNDCRVHLSWRGSDDARLITKLMGRGSLRQTEGVEG